MPPLIEVEVVACASGYFDVRRVRNQAFRSDFYDFARAQSFFDEVGLGLNEDEFLGRQHVLRVKRSHAFLLSAELVQLLRYLSSVAANLVALRNDLTHLWHGDLGVEQPKVRLLTLAGSTRSVGNRVSDVEVSELHVGRVRHDVLFLDDHACGLFELVVNDDDLAFHKLQTCIPHGRRLVFQLHT